MTRAFGRLDWSGLLCAAFNAVWYGRGVRTFVHALSGNCRILKSHFEHRHLQMGVESWVCQPSSPEANVLAEANSLIDPIRPPRSTRWSAYWDSATPAGVCAGACAGNRVVNDDATCSGDCDPPTPPRSPSNLSMPSAGSSGAAGARAFGGVSLSSSSSISSSRSSTAAKLDRSLADMRSERRGGVASKRRNVASF